MFFYPMAIGSTIREILVGGTITGMKAIKFAE